MPWIFKEETGYFSFCPLTSVSFPSLHPLFPSQNPSLQNTPVPTHFLFLPYPSLTISLTTIVNTTPPPCSHLLPHTYTILSFSHSLFLVCVLSLPSSELFFSYSTCNLGLSSFRLLTHSAICLWMEDAFSIAAHNAVLPSLTFYSEWMYRTCPKQLKVNTMYYKMLRQQF